MGFAPDGSLHHNGIDHWWDDEGDGNCWQGNTYSRGGADLQLHPAPALVRRRRLGPVPGRAVKDAGFLSCSEYDRNDPDFRHPPGCEWFDDPDEPGEGGRRRRDRPRGIQDSDTRWSPRCWPAPGWSR